MIVTRLFGGLGNQMFQYAFGFALAQRFGQPLYYDLRFFSEAKDPLVITPRNFGLNAFNLSTQEWPAENNAFFFPDRSIQSRLYHKVKRMLGFSTLLYERKNGYDPEVVALAKPNSYLAGYWQSPLYFLDAAKALKQEFQFVGIPDSPYPDLIARCENSVAIHVRRGDYAHNSSVHAKHGLLAMEYYRKAIDTIKERVGGITHFFIFSDDLDFCQLQFEWLANATIADTRHLPEWYDMYLMSLCQHHIIANSTYSWWGAWLGSNFNQWVIAPANWQQNIHPSDWNLCPNEWLIL